MSFSGSTRDPIGLATLDPGTVIWTNLVKDNYTMLHTNFQASVSGTKGSKEDFLLFLYISRTPWDRVILSPETFI